MEKVSPYNIMLIMEWGKAGITGRDLHIIMGLANVFVLRVAEAWIGIIQVAAPHDLLLSDVCKKRLLWAKISVLT